MSFVKLEKFILVAIFICFQITYAYSTQPIKFIDTLVSETTLILSSNQSEDLKIDKLKKIATENVDINGIGLYTLGKHRKTLNDDLKKEYNELFKEYFLKSFANRLVQYKEAKIEIISEDKKNEKYTIVSSVLNATKDRPEIKIDWRVYTKNPERPLIRDLIIEDLSLARTQKEEFNSVIQGADGNIDALFSKLKEFNNQ